MKRFLASFVCVMLLAGCASGNTTGGTTASESAAAPTTAASEPVATSEAAPSEPAVKMETIKVWSDNAHEKELRDKQVEEFNNGAGKDLGINIEYTVYGTNYSDTIQIAAKAGDTPHIFRPDNKLMNDFVEAGYVIPLEDMPNSADLIAKYEGMLASQYHIFNGKVYTLPYNLTTYKFVINTDLFDKAGIPVPTTWSWADVRENAKKITEVGAGDAFGFGLSLNSQWTISSYLTMPGGVNVGHYGFDYNTMSFNFSAFEPLVSAIYGMAQDGSIFPGFEGLDGDGVRAQFSEGKIGIMGAASFDAAVYNEQFPAKCNWAVVSEPAFEASGSPYKEFVQPTQLLVMGPKAKENPEKCMEVYKFFYSDECAAQMYEQGLYVPLRNEAIAMAAKQPDMKGFAEFANVPDKFVMAPMPDTLITVEGPAYREILANFWSGTLGNDAAKVLKDCDDRYNAALSSLPQEKLDLFKLPEGTSLLKK